MTVVVLVCAALLAVTAALAAFRVERGPSMLDRTVGLDILTSAVVGAIALEAAWSRRIDTVPILVVLALVGFIGSVSIARFASAEPEGEGRILTREELAALESERRAAEEADRSVRAPRDGEDR
ncbi:MAG: pH regulation protein [Actinotalea sp.]|nr:pH regulation protein [Actinotalea sp.]